MVAVEQQVEHFFCLLLKEKRLIKNTVLNVLKLKKCEEMEGDDS